VLQQPALPLQSAAILTSDPPAPIRRWQGTTTLIGFEPLAWPTARIARGAPSLAASAP
jgi:hypothetical protein